MSRPGNLRWVDIVPILALVILASVATRACVFEAQDLPVYGADGQSVGDRDPDSEWTPVESLQQRSGRGVLRGRVVNEQQEGLEGASLLTVDKQRTLWTFTDSSGGFMLEGISGAQLELVLDHPQFAPQKVSVLPGTEAVEIEMAEVAPGQPVTPQLNASEFSGQVTNLEGLPLANHELVLIPKAGAEVPWSGIPRRVLTDVDGEFVIGDLLQGHYTAALLPPGYHGGSWPNLLVPANSPALELVHGSDPERRQLESIAGELAGYFGTASAVPLDRALEGALVSASPTGPSAPGREGPGQFFGTRTGERGAFRIPHLPPGEYRVELTSGALSLQTQVVVLAGKSVDPGF